MRPNKPRVVSPDEAHIRRDGEQAHIDDADSSYGGMSLNVGPKIARMTDEEIVEAREDLRASLRGARQGTVPPALRW